MDDLTIRLIVVAGIAVSAALAAIASREGRARRRRPFASTDLKPGLHLFSSGGCASCDRARSTLEAGGRSFVEHTYEAGSRTFEANGIDRVPTIAWVPDDRPAGWIVEGVPSEGALKRWFGP